MHIQWAEQDKWDTHNKIMAAAESYLKSIEEKRDQWSKDRADELPKQTPSLSFADEESKE